MNEREFASKLKKLCKEYDRQSGEWPDPYKVGQDFYDFYLSERKKAGEKE